MHNNWPTDWADYHATFPFAEMNEEMRTKCDLLGVRIVSDQNLKLVTVIIGDWPPPFRVICNKKLKRQGFFPSVQEAYNAMFDTENYEWDKA